MKTIQKIFSNMRAMPIFMEKLRQANREGLKSKTRRVINPQVEDNFWQKKMNHASIWSPKKELPNFCPYGKVGDVVYMREPLVRIGERAFYKDDVVPAFSLVTGEPIKWRWNVKTLSGMFMPREAARFLYLYDEIRVERVQEISCDDAKAEGVSGVWVNPPVNKGHYRRVLLNPYVANYSVLWDEINAKRGYGWDLNPWVWVLGYKPIKILSPGTVGRDLSGLKSDFVIFDEFMGA